MEDNSLALDSDIPSDSLLSKDLAASSATDSLFNGGSTQLDQVDENKHSLIADSNLYIDNPVKKTSQDFADQIRKLEIEGNKLRAITARSLDIGAFTSGSLDVDGSFEFPKTQSSTSLGYLSGAIDGSSDQKYLTDFKTQLEIQRRETDQLTKQLLGDSFSYRSSSLSLSNGGALPSHAQGKPAFTTYSSSQWAQTLSRKSLESFPPPHLERSLKESQEQIAELRKKLHEVTDASDQQKRQFRQTVEELKSKLHDTIHKRDAELDLRQKEANSQELLIGRLQTALTQLQDHSKLQEETLSSAAKQLDSMKHLNELNESALNQIGAILLERERSHGHTYFKSDMISGQNTSILVHTLDRCLRDLDNEINLKTMKIMEVETELEIMKKSLTERERNITFDYQEILRKEKDEAIKKVAMITAEHEKTMASMDEKLSSTSRKMASLQSQLQQTEDKYRELLNTKERELKEMEEKMVELRTENMKSTASWQEKMQALESSLDQIQKELIAVRADKNDLLQSLSKADARMESLQATVVQLEADLDTERDRVQQQRHREELLRSEVMALELQASNKQGEIERLGRMVEMVKQECSLQVLEKQNLLSSSEKLERENYLDQIKQLSAQLATLTEKYNNTSVELHVARNDSESLKSEVDSLTNSNEKTRSMVEAALADKNDLVILLKEKTDQIDRVLRERDQYTSLAEQRAEELSRQSLGLETMRAQLEEKEKVLGTLRQQSSSIAQLMEIHTKATDNVREEKERLAAVAAEKEALLLDLRTTVETLSGQLKVQEQRAERLEDNVSTLNKSLDLKSEEIESLQGEKKNIQAEVMQLKADLETMTSKKNALKKEVMKARTLHTKEVTKLQAKLKECEQETRLSVKALRSKDIIDNKAVKYADKIQKEITVKRSEVDHLTSKLHRLEDKLETVTKEKALVERDKDSLKKSLAKSLQRSQELSCQLESTLSQNSQLMARLSQLEKDIEQRSSNYQTSMETFEQEKAKLKLKHQLDLKEVQSVGRCKTGSLTSLHRIGSHLPSSSLKQRPVTSDRCDFTDASESDSPLNGNSKTHLRSMKPRTSSEVSRELKSLLGEMKHLISEPDDMAGRLDMVDAHAKDRKSRKDRADRKRITPGMSIVGDNEESSRLSSSVNSLASASDGISYKDWRPRSKSLTRPMGTSMYELTQGQDRDISNITQTQSLNNCKGLGNIKLPDTQDLCRRLEEKIESLSKMGGNLIRENKVMANLIDLQGEKIKNVRQLEQEVW